MLAIFLKTLALIVIFDVFCLAIFGAYRHRWLPFRAVCVFVASVCLAGFVAVLLS